jgi:acetylornithine deacetylase/succinyl-diaminopimelate desuccinylase-like protein
MEFFSNLSMEVREIKIGKHAVVFAKTTQIPDRPTVLVYGHYDVQPTDDTELWESAPFVLTERNARLYGRGASDNKGPYSAVLAAVHDLITSGQKLNLNLKFIVEGEEEIGSCSIPRLLRTVGNELAADFAIVADTWSFDEKNIVITTGLRGIVGCEVEVHGATQDLHSGYGGPVPNPIRVLTDICSSLHTKVGYVNIPGFYDDVVRPSTWERGQIRRLPLSDGEMKRILEIPNFKLPHAGFSAAETMRFFPALEFNGIGGGFQGDGIKTIIPCRAFAKITCRLVPNQSAEKIKKSLSEKLLSLCPGEVLMETKFEQASDPYLFDVRLIKNKVLAKAIATADGEIKNIFGNSPVYMREGGSIGLVTMLKDVLGMDSIMVGLSTSADNIHAPNESIAISMLEKGRKFFRSFLAKLGN